MGRRVDVGRAFNGEIRLIESKSRRFVTYAAVGVGSALVVGSAILGTVVGDFSALEHVWIVVGPFYGAIGGYYFGTIQQKTS